MHITKTITLNAETKRDYAEKMLNHDPDDGGFLEESIKDISEQEEA